MAFQIIQGGMGVGVSNWRLAREVSRLGQLGVVSGTGLAIVMLRRLQQGDPDGSMRRALARFPIADMAQRALDRYFVSGGIPVDRPYKLSPLPQLKDDQSDEELIVLANFAEVFLAREGHDGVVGINYLEKIQIPTLPSLYGAMLAGVDYVLMGAGIPRWIPGILDALSQGRPAELKIDVSGAAQGESFACRFDPAKFCGGAAPALRRPKFVAIISSATLAMTLARKSNGQVDGFVIEGPTAGGHNAPPRGPAQLNDRGEPLYGPRDTPDLEKIRELNIPFWMAGGFAEPARLAEALAAGAQGVQVGTAFAFCEESGIDPQIKRQVLERVREGRTDLFTDPAASPTGFPFKVLTVEGTLSDNGVYEHRQRLCDLGYLRQVYREADGTLGYRCPAEPAGAYANHGGNVADTAGRKCICNALFGTIGLGQRKPDGRAEPAIVTAGDDVANLGRFLSAGRPTSYSAADVIQHLLTPAAVGTL